MSALETDYETTETEITIEPIHSRAMLVSLRLSTWTARRYDKKVSLEAAANNGAASDAGRFNKMLIPADSPTYKALMQLVGSIRTEHYQNTLAWSDEGWRLLPTANFQEFSDFTRKSKAVFSDLLEDFLTAYPTMRDAASYRLGAMYNEADFPTVSEIRGKFGFYLDFKPLPAKGDFRIDLPAEQVRLLEHSMEARTQDAVGTAMKDAWERLHTCVSHIKERLSNPDGIFRDTLISNAKDLCDVLSRLNVTGDVNLEAFRSEMAEYIACQDPDTLRDDKEVRESVATLADDIVNRMSAFYSPEGN